MRKLNCGQLLRADELKEIAENYRLTTHAKKRILERNMDENIIREIILNPMIAYFNTDYSINIALDEYNYFVITYNDYYKKYNIVTFKEKSMNNINIFTKWHKARNGELRKDNNLQKVLDNYKNK